MRNKHIYLFIFSFFILETSAQKIQDSVSLPQKKQYNLFIGANLFAPLSGIWDKAKTIEANADFRFYKHWHLALEVGQQKNNYRKINWDVDVKGSYYKAGINWSFKEMTYSNSDFFYAGFRYVFLKYNQQINAYPLSFRSYNKIDDESEAGSQTNEPVDSQAKSENSIVVKQINQKFGAVNLSASWIEFVIGARKSLWKNRLFLDTSVRPKILLSSKKQQGIKPLTLPGFGDNINKLNISLSVSLNYKIPLFKLKSNAK